MTAALLYILPLAMVALALLLPLRRTRDADPLAPIKAQLVQVDVDVARGLIAAEDAETNRLEIKRRMLRAAAKQETSAQSTLGRLPQWLTPLSLIVISCLGGLFYSQLGMPGLPAAKAQIIKRTERVIEAGGPTYGEAIAVLKERIAFNPEDATAWQHLASTTFSVGQFSEAAKAYDVIADLNADEKSAAVIRQFQAMMALTRGEISLPAKLVLDEFITLEPDHIAGAYFTGLYQLQTDNRAAAFDTWLALAERSAPDAGFMPRVTALLAEMQPDNPRVQALLPEQPKGIAPALSDEQRAMAENMSADEQLALINSMLARLESRLEENPSDAAGWERLAEARIKLGEIDKARKALEAGMSHVTALEKVRLKALLDNLPTGEDAK